MKIIRSLMPVLFFGISVVWAEDPDGLKIIDAHTHTIFSGKGERTSGIPETQEEYFKEWTDAGVVGAVSHTMGNGKGYVDLRKKNVISCFGLEAKVDKKKLEEGLKSKKYGCIKVYLGYVHQYAFHNNYTPAYLLARKYKVPVVFHTGDTYSTKALLKYADPLTVDDVAVKYPDINFVIAHSGNPWIESAAEVAYKNPNVYLDASAFVVGDLERLSKEQLDTSIVKPVSWIFNYVEDPKKLMFGTDWPLTKIKPYVAAFKKAIPKENWKAVFHDNAARVFQLSTTSQRP